MLFFNRQSNNDGTDRTSLLDHFRQSTQRCISNIEIIVDTLNGIIYAKLDIFFYHLTPQDPNIVFFQEVQQIVRIKSNLSKIGKKFNDVLLEFSTACAESLENMKEAEIAFLQNIFELYETLLFRLAEVDTVINKYIESDV